MWQIWVNTALRMFIMTNLAAMMMMILPMRLVMILMMVVVTSKSLDCY